MTKKNCFLMALVAMFSLITSGCFSIEQEIFLQTDGSGDMVMHLSLPDLPEALMKNSPAAGAGQPDPKAMIEEMKQKFSAGLPPTVQLKEVKEVKQNGAYGFYIVLHFKQLSDLEAALDSYSKDTLGEKGTEPKAKDESYWKVAVEKKGDLTVITQRLFMDLAGAMGKAMMDGDKEKTPEPVAVDEPPAAPKATPKPIAKRTAKPAGRPSAAKTKPEMKAEPKEKEEEFQPPPMSADPFKDLLGGEAMQMMFSMMFKFRFIVHAPKNFTETNADIVLNGNTAIWNASLGAFINEKDPKEKKVMEMKIVY
ncbi:MAG: hypothetical protein ACKVZH_03615 [Blastocatellia bacterium]